MALGRQMILLVVGLLAFLPLSPAGACGTCDRSVTEEKPKTGQDLVETATSPGSPKTLLGAACSPPISRPA